MHSKEQQLLSDIYQHYFKTGQRTLSIRFSNQTEKYDICNALDNLCDDGYVEYLAQATGMCSFKITPLGIQFVENEYQEPCISPIVQGANSIYVNGSGNNISNNYNQISVDIARSDLPDDCKNLIESFLLEMKSKDLTPEKKSAKIRSFLNSISSGTISGVASSGLTALLSSLLNQIPL